LGKITILLRQHRDQQIAKAKAHRKKHREDLLEANEGKAERKAIKENTHKPVELNHTVAKLTLELRERDGIGRKYDHLRGQFNRRITDNREYPFTPAFAKYRSLSKPHALKMKPSTDQPKVEYLTELVHLMIQEDAKHYYPTDAPPPSDLVRAMPIISLEHTNPVSAIAKLEQQESTQLKAVPKDDPILVKLLDQYKGKMMVDKAKVKGRNKFQLMNYLVVDVQHDTLRGGGYYEATCAVVRKCEDGQWRIPRDHYIVEGDEEMANPKLLVGYYLVDLADPERPNYFGDVAECIAAHEESEAL
jgi:hypothetical protein